MREINKYKEEGKQWETALTLDAASDSVGMAIKTIIRLHKNKQIIDAIEYGHAWLNKHKYHAEVLQPLIRAHLDLPSDGPQRRANLEATEPLARKALELNPGNLHIKQLLAETLLRQGKNDEARVLLQELYDQDPNNRYARQELRNLNLSSSQGT